MGTLCTNESMHFCDRSMTKLVAVTSMIKVLTFVKESSAARGKVNMLVVRANMRWDEWSERFTCDSGLFHDISQTRSAPLTYGWQVHRVQRSFGRVQDVHCCWTFQALCILSTCKRLGASSCTRSENPCVEFPQLLVSSLLKFFALNVTAFVLRADSPHELESGIGFHEMTLSKLQHLFPCSESDHHISRPVRIRTTSLCFVSMRHPCQCSVLLRGT